MFSFTGRATRTSFWLVFMLSIFVTFVTVVFSILAIPALLIIGILSPDIASVVSALLYLLLIPMWIISIANGVKRFHDRDKSGWWVLISLVPIIGQLWILIECGFLAGTAGPNKFGENPRVSGVPGESHIVRNAVIIFIAVVLIGLGARAIWAFYKMKTSNFVANVDYSMPIVQQPSTSTMVPTTQNTPSGSGSQSVQDQDLMTQLGGGDLHISGTMNFSSNPTGDVKISTSSVPLSGTPVAVFTADGLTSLTVDVTGGTKWVKYEWDSANGDEFLGTYSAEQCTDPSSNIALTTGVLFPYWAKDSMPTAISKSLAGCTLTRTFTVKNRTSGKSVTATVIIKVK